MKKTETKTKKTKEGKIIYTIKAIIPTGLYSNIQPEITMEAPSIEHAEGVLFPHIKQLFNEYTNYIEKNPPQASTKVETPAPTPTPTPAPKPAKPEVSPFDKALDKVLSTHDPEALLVIRDMVAKSVKLTDLQKIKLYEIINAKITTNN